MNFTYLNKKNFTWEPFFKAAQDDIGVTSS